MDFFDLEDALEDALDEAKEDPVPSPCVVVGDVDRDTSISGFAMTGLKLLDRW